MSVVSGILQAFARRRVRGVPGRIVPSKGWTALDSKRAPHGYVKGKGVKSVGRHTKYGGYKIMAHKIPRYIMPDLSGFTVSAGARPADPRKARRANENKGSGFLAPFLGERPSTDPGRPSFFS